MCTGTISLMEGQDNYEIQNTKSCKTKGQLILKGNFGVFNSSKDKIFNFCPSCSLLKI